MGDLFFAVLALLMAYGLIAGARRLKVPGGGAMPPHWTESERRLGRLTVIVFGIWVAAAWAFGIYESTLKPWTSDFGNLTRGVWSFSILGSSLTRHFILPLVLTNVWLSFVSDKGEADRWRSRTGSLNLTFGIFVTLAMIALGCYAFAFFLD